MHGSVVVNSGRYVVCAFMYVRADTWRTKRLLLVDSEIGYMAVTTAGKPTMLCVGLLGQFRCAQTMSSTMLTVWFISIQYVIVCAHVSYWICHHLRSRLNVLLSLQWSLPPVLVADTNLPCGTLTSERAIRQNARTSSGRKALWAILNYYICSFASQYTLAIKNTSGSGQTFHYTWCYVYSRAHNLVLAKTWI